MPQPARDTRPSAGVTDAAFMGTDAAVDVIAREAHWRPFEVRDFWFEAPDTIVEHPVAVIDSVEYAFEVDGVVIETGLSTDVVRDARSTTETIALGDRRATLETIVGSNGGALVLRWVNATRAQRGRGGRRVIVLDLSPTTLSLRWHTERERVIARRIAVSLRLSAAPPDARAPTMSDAGADTDAGPQ
jgi:hypothetical protein